jgi:hypothetical protein
MGEGIIHMARTRIFSFRFSKKKRGRAKANKLTEVLILERAVILSPSELCDAILRLKVEGGDEKSAMITRAREALKHGADSEHLVVDNVLVWGAGGWQHRCSLRSSGKGERKEDSDISTYKRES